MDFVTGAHELEVARPRAAFTRRAIAFLERESLLVVLCSFIVMRSTLAAGNMLGSDSWFSFLYGREVLRNGLPHHDTLTVMGGGVDWIDQQWLGHVALYGLSALGGPKLAVLVSALLFTIGFLGAAVLARLRGGSPLALLVIGVLASFYSTTIVQAEVFSRVLFLVLLVLLAAESRKRSRRVWLAFPLLVLWANVHGAVVLGAGLVALLGAIEVFHWALGRNPGRRPLARAVALLAIPWACLFATPYGLSVAGYYRLTIFSSAFHQYIDPWKPPTPLSRWGGPFFLLVLVAAVIFLRYHRRLTLFEKAVLGATLLAALEARRSIPWFAAACILLLPVACRREGRARATRTSAPFRFAAPLFALVFALVVVGQAAARPQRAFTTYYYDERVAALVARYAEAHPNARIWANDPYGDWVVYLQPSLWGKVAYDARWENLSPREIAALHDFEQLSGPSWEAPIYQYDLVLVSRHSAKRLLTALKRDPRLRLVFQNRQTLIFEPLRAPA